MVVPSRSRLYSSSSGSSNKEVREKPMGGGRCERFFKNDGELPIFDNHSLFGIFGNRRFFLETPSKETHLYVVDETEDGDDRSDDGEQH